MKTSHITVKRWHRTHNEQTDYNSHIIKTLMISLGSSGTAWIIQPTDMYSISNIRYNKYGKRRECQINKIS